VFCGNADVETAIPINITTVTSFAVTNGSCSTEWIAALIAKYNAEQQLETDATGVRLNYTFEVVNCTEVRQRDWQRCGMSLADSSLHMTAAACGLSREMELLARHFCSAIMVSSQVRGCSLISDLMI
jgi:hypothetical protein